MDCTSVHPESYEAAEALLKKLGFQPEDITKGSLKELGKKIHDYKKMAAELNVGDMTLQDIVKELENLQEIPERRCQSPFYGRMCWR